MKTQLRFFPLLFILLVTSAPTALHAQYPLMGEYHWGTYSSFTGTEMTPMVRVYQVDESVYALATTVVQPGSGTDCYFSYLYVCHPPDDIGEGVVLEVLGPGPTFVHQTIEGEGDVDFEREDADPGTWSAYSTHNGRAQWHYITNPDQDFLVDVFYATSSDSTGVEQKPKLFSLSPGAGIPGSSGDMTLTGKWLDGSTSVQISGDPGLGISPSSLVSPVRHGAQP